VLGDVCFMCWCVGRPGTRRKPRHGNRDSCSLKHKGVRCTTRSRSFKVGCICRSTAVHVCREQPLTSVQPKTGNIRVFCRVRPVRTGARTVVKAITSGDKLEQKIVVHHPKTRRDRSFELDRVFQHSDSQGSVELGSPCQLGVECSCLPHKRVPDTVFAQARPVVQSVLDGYNACIFAYGQVNCGVGQ